jgi:hypothetical protein
MGITLVSCVRIEFEERRLSLFEEPGKHDCIVGATMEEFNLSKLQEKKTIFYNNLVQAWLHICLLFQACSLYFEVDW